MVVSLLIPITRRNQTSWATDGKLGTIQRNRNVAANPPASVAAMKRGTSVGRILQMCHLNSRQWLQPDSQMTWRQ